MSELHPIFAEIIDTHMGATKAVTPRAARCAHCRKIVASDPSLPFFQFRGEGSREATEACKVCKCFEVAHHPRGDDAPEALRGKIPSIIGEPHPFEPHGPWEFDLFYCGCRGWE